MPERVACNLCGADDAELLYALRDERLLVDDVEWNLVRCRRCGLGYVNPRPTRAEIGRYYPDGYFALRPAMTERYVRQAAYLPSEPGRLLDVGTAGGEFLAVARERGWEVEGIEPRQAAGAYGVRVHRLDFPDAGGLEAESFDVVTAWAVLEHLHDPAAAFREAARLLRPGGRLIVQVPNLRSIQMRWARQEDLPRHLYCFSEATLRRYAARSGLEVTRIVHTTNLFGGSGRGVLRLALVRGLGGTTADFYEIWRTPRRGRFRRWPLLACAWTATGVFERVFLPDWAVRGARLSGQIVVEMRKPAAQAASPTVREAA